MSMKSLGSKLASGVHKVKLKREQESPATPKKTVPATKPVVKLAAKPVVQKPEAKSTPVSVAAKPVAPRAAQQTAASLEKLHPSRIWPD